MAFDSTAFKTQFASSLKLPTQPAVAATPPPQITSASAAPSFAPQAPAIKTANSTPSVPVPDNVGEVLKTGIKLLNPLHKVTVRPAFNTSGETQEIYGGVAVEAAHDVAARTMEAIPNIITRTIANFAPALNNGQPAPIPVPFDTSRIGMENTNPQKLVGADLDQASADKIVADYKKKGQLATVTPDPVTGSLSVHTQDPMHEVSDTGTELIRKFDEFQKANPGKPKTNIALAVIAGPVTDALNAFVAGDIATGAAKALLKTTRFDPQLNWAIDMYGMKGSGLSGNDFTEELTRRFNQKATTLIKADDMQGLDQLGEATRVILSKLTGGEVPQLSKLGTMLENTARTALQDSKYGFKLQDPRFAELAPEAGVDATGARSLPGTRDVYPNQPAFGLSVKPVESVGGAEQPKPFEGFDDLTTKTLDKLKGRTTVSKQFIENLTNQPDLKQTERDLVRDVLANEGAQVNVPDFAKKVRAELLPLKRMSVSDESDMGGGPRYESINLPADQRGPVADYDEHIYRSPIKTSAGKVHFSDTDPGDYFGHTRVEDLPVIREGAPSLSEVLNSGKAQSLEQAQHYIEKKYPSNEATRRVIEVQSDLFQKGRLENEGRTRVRMTGEQYDTRAKELAKLEPYKNNAAHFRMIREEVKQAAKDGKTKLQFPTGETAMKIEGLGDSSSWRTGSGPLTPENMKVGDSVFRETEGGMPIGHGSVDWIITDVLGDGKFKAMPKVVYERMVSDGDTLRRDPRDTENRIRQDNESNETFDISGKVDTENPIYKFYEKEVGRYLKNKYGVSRVTDPQGVSWWEVKVKPEHKGPVEAFKASKGVSKIDFNLTKPEAEKLFRGLFSTTESDFFFKESINNGKALGRFSVSPDGKAMVEVVSNNGKVSDAVVYHEAFHTYLRSFVSEEERASLLNEVAPDQDADAAEEVLADAFADYVKTKKAKGKLAQFFDSVLTRIKRWIGALDRAQSAYEDILNGRRTSTKGARGEAFKENENLSYEPTDDALAELPKPEALSVEKPKITKGTKDIGQLARMLERVEKSLGIAKANPEGYVKAYGPTREAENVEKAKSLKQRIAAAKLVEEINHPSQAPSEDESYQVMADQHLQTQPYLKASISEEDAMVQNLTSVFKDMKGISQEVLDAKLTDQDLEEARQHYEFLQDAILDHPGRALAKYVSPETGMLPEVRGTKVYTGEEIKTPRGIWATRGDTIFQDLVGQELSKGGDIDVAQEMVDQYRNMRKQLADVQSNLRTIRNTIHTQKLKDTFVESSKRAIARSLVKDMSTLKNLVEAAQKAGYMKGVAAGDRKVMTIVNRIKSRRTQIVAIQKSYDLSDKQMKNVTQNADWRLVPPNAFDEWLKKVNERALVESHKNVTKQIINALIEDSNLKNTDNLRVAMDLPVVSKMDLAQMQEYENALSQYQYGDSFVGPRMMTTLENTDLAGVKTWREFKEKLSEETGEDFSKLADVRGNWKDKFTYDQALALKNPLYKYMVMQHAAKEVEAAQKLEFIQHNLDKLAKAARKSRGQARVDKFIPQDKEVFGWLNTAEEDKAAYAKQRRMTPEELEYARYVQALYRGWRDILIEKATLTKWREAYITHSPRAFLERWLEESRSIREGDGEHLVQNGPWRGFVKSVVAEWRQAVDTKVDFSAVGDTGQVLGLEKFFKYSLPRGKEVIPSKNVARVVMQYARNFYKKDVLDQIIPKVEAYTMALQRAPGAGVPKDPTGLNVDGKLKEFVKQWLNNKKGRTINALVDQGSKLDAGIRIMNVVMTLKYLGFNLVAQPTSAIGEVVANFIGMELPEFSTGAKRFASKEGRKIAARYPGVVGEPPFERLISAANDIGDTIMAGAFYIFQEVSYRARQQFFLGFLTPEEYSSGVVSSARQAEIKTEMGRYRPVEGSKSLAGNTSEGKILTKFKDWAPPLLFTAARDTKAVIKFLKEARTATGADKAAKVKAARRLARFLVSSVGIYLVFNWVFQKDKDNSMLGKIKGKIAQELGSGLSAIDPNTWLQPPALLTFMGGIAGHIEQLALLESYQSSGPGYKKGDLKGLRGLGQDITPALIRQFLPTSATSSTINAVNDSPFLPKPDSSSTSSSSPTSKNPALKRLQALKKSGAHTNPALDRLKELKAQNSSTTNPALKRLKALRGG